MRFFKIIFFVPARDITTANYEGHNAYYYGGHPAPTGPALPNLKPYRIGGHPAPDGASPTQPYKCGQNVKVKVKTSAVFDVDFKILTALKGWVGHAPQGRGALHNHRHGALHIIII